MAHNRNNVSAHHHVFCGDTDTLSLKSFLMIFIYSHIIYAVNGTTSYFVGSTQLDWWKSYHYCNQNVSGGELASIHSVEEYEQARTKCEAVAGSGEDGGCWIGLNKNNYDVNNERIWQWRDGTNTDYGFINNTPTTGISPWGGSEPNNINGGNEFCVQFYTENSYQWNDAACGWKIYPLCMIITLNPTKLPTTSPTLLPTKASVNPTINPSTDPTQHPTSAPSLVPTKSPIKQPTSISTATPTTTTTTTTAEPETSDDENVVYHHSTEWQKPKLRKPVTKSIDTLMIVILSIIGFTCVIIIIVLRMTVVMVKGAKVKQETELLRIQSESFADNTINKENGNNSDMIHEDGNNAASSELSDNDNGEKHNVDDVIMLRQLSEEGVTAGIRPDEFIVSDDNHDSNITKVTKGES